MMITSATRIRRRTSRCVAGAPLIITAAIVLAQVARTDEPTMSTISDTLAFLKSKNTAYKLDLSGRICRVALSDDSESVLKRLQPFNGLVALDTALFGTDLNLAGAKLLAQAKDLTTIDLQGCDPARLPPEAFGYLASLPKLESLDVDYRGNIDDALKHLAGAKRLRLLYMSGVKTLTDRGLRNLAPLQSVEQLGLRQTRITDAGMAYIAQLKNLRGLCLDGTEIGDAGIREIGALHRLESLGLNGTKVTDKGLQALHELAELKKLDLGETEISDNSLDWIGRLKKLKFLDLQATQVTDAGIARLFAHPHLENVSLAYSRVTAEGARRLQESLPTEHAKASVRGYGPSVDAETYQLLKRTKTEYTNDDFGKIVSLTVRSEADSVMERLQPLDRLESFGSCVKESGLSLAGAKLLSKAENLKSVYLFGCDPKRLPPEAFACFAALPKLEELSTDYCGNIDEAMRQVAESKSLRVLLIDGTSFEAVGDGSLPPIRIVPAEKIPLTDHGLEYLPRLRLLERLYIGDTDVTDIGVRYISRLPSLDELDLGETHITNAAMQYIAGIKSLRRLVLPCTVGDAGLREIGKMPRLRALCVCGPNVTDNGVLALHDLKAPCALTFTDTRITDSSLEWLGSLQQLTALHFTGAEITDAGIKHLHGHPTLASVELRRTHVTAAGAADLQKSLLAPNAVVIHD